MTDYLNYYQSKIEVTGLSDAKTKAEFDEVEKEYGTMRHLSIPPDITRTLTMMLIAERDMLCSSVDVVFSVYDI